MKEKIEISLITEEGDIWKGWLVKQGDKYADGLGYDEMLGLIAALTLPQDRPTLHWMKTAEQHKAWRDRLGSSEENTRKEEVQAVPFEDTSNNPS